MKCSFDLVFMDFTYIVSLLPNGWGGLLWLCHCVSDSTAILFVVLWEACWCLLLWPGGREQSQLLWLLGTVWCSCLQMLPQWSAEEASSASVAAVMLSVGSIVFSAWTCIGCKRAWCGGLEDSWFPCAQHFYTTVSFIGTFCTYL